MGEDQGALLQDFVTESTEMLEGLDQLFVELETNPNDSGIINQIFRPVHSIKGNSSFFNLINIKDFSHTLETLLQDIRAGKRQVDKDVINALLRGMDMLREMINNLASGNISTEMTAEEKAHLVVMAALTAGGGGAETPESLANKVRSALSAISGEIPDAAQFKALHSACEKLVDLVAPIKAAAGGAPVFVYKTNGKDITDALTLLNETIENLVAWSKDKPDAMDKFGKTLAELIDIAGKDAPLGEIFVKMEDQFSTIYGSPIPFDDLLASIFVDLMNEAQPLIEKSEVAGGEASGDEYKIGGKDVGGEIKFLEEAITNLVAWSKDKPDEMEKFGKTLSELIDIAGKDSPIGQIFVKMDDQFSTIYHSSIPFDDLLASIFTDLLKEAHPLFDKATASAEKPAPTSAASATAAAPAAHPAEEKENQPAAKTAEKSQKSLRVSEETIDMFISYVSELITTGEVFHYLQKHLEQNADPRKILREFKNANSSFNNLSTGLQKSIMAIRRVPMKQVLQKLPRIVRDVATQLNKKVELTVIGEDLQIDKSLLENLESPLIHMVRNSVDHGVEIPENRVAAGKPEVGEVTLDAKIVEDRCVIKLKDDGAGINVDAVKKKSVANGIITQEKADSMSNSEAFRLIFAAGVSTAKKITDVSGRGVGMDVVLSNITAMNGTVELESELGKGTEVVISLPLTMMTLVIDGVIARVDNDNYIVPLTDIRNLIRPSSNQFCSIAEKGKMLLVRDELYRLLRLNDFFNQASGAEPLPETVKETNEDTTIILVEAEGKTCGLVVDEIIGQQSVVLKRMDAAFKEQKFLRGTAILGDGRVGLVLNTKDLISSAYHI